MAEANLQPTRPTSSWFMFGSVVTREEVKLERLCAAAEMLQFELSLQFWRQQFGLVTMVGWAAVKMKSFLTRRRNWKNARVQDRNLAWGVDSIGVSQTAQQNVSDHSGSHVEVKYQDSTTSVGDRYLGGILRTHTDDPARQIGRQMDPWHAPGVSSNTARSGDVGALDMHQYESNRVQIVDDSLLCSADSAAALGMGMEVSKGGSSTAVSQSQRSSRIQLSDQSFGSFKNAPAQHADRGPRKAHEANDTRGNAFARFNAACK